MGPSVLAEPNLRIEGRLEHGWKEAESPHATVQVRARESLIIVSYRLRSTWPCAKTLVRFSSLVTQVQGGRPGHGFTAPRRCSREAEELTALCKPPAGQTTSISQRTTFLKTRGAARCARRQRRQVHATRQGDVRTAPRQRASSRGTVPADTPSFAMLPRARNR